MKRLVLVLLLANLLFFGWNRGWFDSGRPSQAVRESSVQDPDLLRPVPLERLREKSPAPADPASPQTVPGAQREPADDAMPPEDRVPSDGGIDRAPPVAAPVDEDRPEPVAEPDFGSGNVDGQRKPGDGGPASRLPGGEGTGAFDPSAAGNADREPALVCREFGALEIAAAQGLRSALEESGARVQQREIGTGSSYLVYLPPAPDAGQARQNLEFVRSIGRDDAFVIRDGPLRFGISLGLFRYEAAAQVLVDRLERAGERRAVIGARAPFLVRYVLQARWPEDGAADVTPALARALGERFGAAVRDCG